MAAVAATTLPFAAAHHDDCGGAHTTSHAFFTGATGALVNNTHVWEFGFSGTYAVVAAPNVTVTPVCGSTHDCDMPDPCTAQEGEHIEFSGNGTYMIYRLGPK